jgi:hypothetical protein
LGVLVRGPEGKASLLQALPFRAEMKGDGSKVDTAVRLGEEYNVSDRAVRDMGRFTKRSNAQGPDASGATAAAPVLRIFARCRDAAVEHCVWPNTKLLIRLTSNRRRAAVGSSLPPLRAP